MKLFNTMEKKRIIITLVIITVITEIIDDLLDYLLGSSILHSVLQMILFLALLFLITKVYFAYFSKTVKRLIPEKLVTIIKIIGSSERKGITINLVGIRKQISITKPTLNNRIKQLVELDYITLEEKGNNKYVRLTNKGRAILE